MTALDPVAQALVPVDSSAADALGAPNYDEFQSDREVWELLKQRPLSVLRVTMPHCDVRRAEEIGKDDSDEAIAIAVANMARLASDPRVRRVRDILWVYEITRPEAPGRPQIGLGGMARTAEIRTPDNPTGTIIRNEAIRESKAKGRARLARATHSDMGTVNLAVDDDDDTLQNALRAHVSASAPDFETLDESQNRHRVWLVHDAANLGRLRDFIAREPQAYVADGNHRSAAAAMLGATHFLAVVFPAKTMTIAPYNRLIEAADQPVPDLLSDLEQRFIIDRYRSDSAFQPDATHEIGLYDAKAWSRLRPREGTFDPLDAAQDIDADVVQRLIFAPALGLQDPRDARITYVGANRDAQWLQDQVDGGEFKYAVTLPPVRMEQFVAVCRQNQLMPPKSTWFVPKIRSGLVMAMLPDASHLATL